MTSRSSRSFETEIGRLGAAICYDWLFPEAIRALALAGAEVLIRVSAYMDPWGATPPLDWWTLFNRARAVENFAYVVAANQGASAANYPPFSWPGGSMIVDYDGRILAQADPGPGEKIVVGPSTWPPCGPSGDRRRGPSSPFPSPDRSLYWSLRPAHLSSRRSLPAETGMISPVSCRRRSLHADSPPGRALRVSDPSSIRIEEPDHAFERPRAAAVWFCSP